MNHFHNIEQALKNFKHIQSKELIREVIPVFSRGVVFDTTKHSWRGMSKQIQIPKCIYRIRMAVYYLTEPKQTEYHQRSVYYSPIATEKDDKRVLKEIKSRQDGQRFMKAYKIK